MNGNITVRRLGGKLPNAILEVENDNIYDFYEGDYFLLFLQARNNNVFEIVDVEYSSYIILGKQLYLMGGFTDYYPWDGLAATYIEDIKEKLKEHEK